MKGKRTVVKKTTSSGAKVKSVESRSSKRLKETYKGDGIKSKQKSKNGIVRKTSTTLNGTKEVEKENRQGKRTVKSRGSQASLSRNGNVIKSKTREVTKANGTGHGKKKSTYRQQSREDKSNEFRKMSHEDLLKKADVEKFEGKYKLETLKDGRVAIKGYSK